MYLRDALVSEKKKRNSSLWFLVKLSDFLFEFLVDSVIDRMFARQQNQYSYDFTSSVQHCQSLISDSDVIDRKSPVRMGRFDGAEGSGVIGVFPVSSPQLKMFRKEFEEIQRRSSLRP